jgi:hypothetical protein
VSADTARLAVLKQVGAGVALRSQVGQLELHHVLCVILPLDVPTLDLRNIDINCCSCDCAIYRVNVRLESNPLPLVVDR